MSDQHYLCDCHRRMGNDFWFMPTGYCLNGECTPEPFCENQHVKAMVEAETPRRTSINDFIDKWKAEFYEKYDMSQFENEDFGSIALGFFIAKGCTPDEARAIYEACIKAGAF